MAATSPLHHFGPSDIFASVNPYQGQLREEVPVAAVGCGASASGGSPAYYVKNTFVVEPGQDAAPRLIRRSKSDSDLSSGSGHEEIRYWLGNASGDSNSGQEELPGGHSGPLQLRRDGLPTSLAGAPPPPPPSLLQAENGRRAPPPPPSSVASSSSSNAPRPKCSGPLSRLDLPPPGLGPPQRPTRKAPPPPPTELDLLVRTLEVQGHGASAGAAAAAREHPADQVEPQATVLEEVDPFLAAVHRETQVPMSDLEALDAQGTLRQIPRDPNGQLTSVGSIRHATETCSPCLFWFKGSCAKELRCTYCHFKHKGQKNKRIRPSKATRLRLREQDGQEGTEADDASDVGGEVPQEHDGASQPTAPTGTKMEQGVAADHDKREVAGGAVASDSLFRLSL